MVDEIGDVVEEPGIPGSVTVDDSEQPFDTELPSYAQPDVDVSPEPAEDKSQAAVWDKERQAKDQENANIRKELLASNEDARNQLAAAHAELAQLRQARDKKPGPAEELSRKQLTEETEYADLVAYVKEQTALIGKQDQELARVNAALANVSQGQQADADAQAERDMIAGLSKEYGADIQNEAVQSAADSLVKMGYSKARPPDRAATYMALRLAFIAKRDKAGKTTTTPRKPTIPLDTAKGGRARTTAKKDYETIDEAADAMLAEGKFG